MTVLKREMRGKGWGFWLTALLALGFFFLFLRGAELSGMVKAVAGANYSLALLGVLSYFAGVWFRAVRWRFILTPVGQFRSYRLFFPIVIGFALNNVLPGRVGLLARAYLMGERERVSKVASGTTVVLDQLFDGVALLFFLVAVSLFVPLPGWARTVAVSVFIIYGGLFLLLWLMASFPNTVHRLLRPVERFLSPVWQQKAWEWTDLCLSGLRSLRSPGKMTIVLFLSGLVWLMEAGLFYFVSLAFHLDLPLYTIFLAVSIANLALILPSLPGGIGPFEYFGKQSLLIFGVGETMATVYIGVVHFTFLFPVTVMGLGMLWWQRRSLRRAASGEPE